MASLVDSQQRELSVEEIIGIANMNQQEYPMETSRAVDMVNAELQMPNTLFVRQGNTLFVIHKAEPGVGYFRAFNADTANNYLENSMEFIKACHKMGFDTMSTTFSDPAILQIFRYISRRPPTEGMGYKMQRTGDGKFFGTIKTGPARGTKQ